MPVQKKPAEFVPGPIKAVRHQDQEKKAFSYSLILEDGEHITVSVRREWGASGQISATIFRATEILKHQFERYELDFPTPYTGWSNQKRWLFPLAQNFVWETDAIEEGETNDSKITELKAEIERKQREVILLEAEDKQRYKDVPLPKYLEQKIGAK